MQHKSFQINGLPAVESRRPAPADVIRRKIFVFAGAMMFARAFAQHGSVK
jgi:hypothetical protein